MSPAPAPPSRSRSRRPNWLFVGSNPVVLDELEVTVWPKQSGSVTMHAMSLWTAIGATFFSSSGARTSPALGIDGHNVEGGVEAGAKIPGVSAVGRYLIVARIGNLRTSAPGCG